MRRIDDLDVAGQTVLLRADLNVPLDGARITDDGRTAMRVQYAEPRNGTRPGTSAE